VTTILVRRGIREKKKNFGLSDLAGLAQPGGDPSDGL